MKFDSKIGALHMRFVDLLKVDKVSSGVDDPTFQKYGNVDNHWTVY